MTNRERLHEDIGEIAMTYRALIINKMASWSLLGRIEDVIDGLADWEDDVDHLAVAMYGVKDVSELSDAEIEKLIAERMENPDGDNEQVWSPQL